MICDPSPAPKSTVESPTARDAVTGELLEALQWIVRDSSYKAPEQHNELSIKYAMRAQIALDAIAKAKAKTDDKEQADERIRTIAPDLLAALRDLIEAHMNNTLFSGAGHWERARDAIAKAER